MCAVATMRDSLGRQLANWKGTSVEKANEWQYMKIVCEIERRLKLSLYANHTPVFSLQQADIHTTIHI